MDKTRTLLLLLFVIALYPITKLIFDFVDISFSTYSIYLYWITALVIFMLVLPEKAGKLFTDTKTKI
jgi:hypothetical protein